MHEVIILGPVGSGKSILLDRIRREMNPDVNGEFEFIRNESGLDRVSSEIGDGRVPENSESDSLEWLEVKHKASGKTLRFHADSGENFNKKGAPDFRREYAEKLPIVIINPFLIDKKLALNSFIHSFNDTHSQRVSDCH